MDVCFEKGFGIISIIASVKEDEISFYVGLSFSAILFPCQFSFIKPSINKYAV